MRNVTTWWNQIAEELVDAEKDDAFLDELYDKFGEIFDIKDVTEYKHSVAVEPYYAPSQFHYLSLAIRRAFVEGYLLARMERRHEDMAMLYNCHKGEPEKDVLDGKRKTINDYINNADDDADRTAAKLLRKQSEGLGVRKKPEL